MRAASLILLALLCFRAAATCDVASMTKNCSLLRDLGPNDVLEFPNGQRVPACALLSPEDRRSDDHDAAVEGLELSLRRAMEAAKPPFSEDEIESALNSNRLDILENKKSVRVRWPPLADEREPKMVSPEEIRAYFVGRMGEAGFRAFADSYLGMEKLRREFYSQGSFGERPTFDMRAQGAREEELFKRAKEAVLKDILAGREESELGVAERDVYRRVKALESRGGGYPEDCGPYYMAAFDYSSNEILLPPSLLFLNDQTVMRALVHEISHAFDLCRLSGELENDFTGMGRLAPSNGVARGFPDLRIEASPYFIAQKCLVSAPGGDFGQSGLSSGGPFEKSQVCEHNQQHEAFADWNAARILAGDPTLLDLPPAGPTPTPRQTVKGRVVPAPPGLDVLLLQADAACSESSTSSGKFDNHPSWTDRINKIMMREPALARRAGCDGSAGARCTNTGATADGKPGAPTDSTSSN